MTHERPGALGELLGGRERLREFVTGPLDPRPVGEQPVDLDLRCDRGHEDRRGHPELRGRVGVGEPRVAAGSRDDPDRRIELAAFTGRELPVERASSLEHAARLEELGLEPQALARIGRKHRGASDVRRDPSSGGLDVGDGDHADSFSE